MKRKPIRPYTACVALGVTVPTVYAMLKDGRLTVDRTGGKYFVQPDEKYDALVEKYEALKKERGKK